MYINVWPKNAITNRRYTVRPNQKIVLDNLKTTRKKRSIITTVLATSTTLQVKHTKCFKLGKSANTDKSVNPVNNYIQNK